MDYRDCEAMKYVEYGRKDAVLGCFNIEGSDNGDWDTPYSMFSDACIALGIENGGVAVEKLLGIWINLNDYHEDPPLPDHLTDLVKALSGPHGYALLKAYRLKHGLEK